MVNEMGLADRVEQAFGSDLGLDVLVEVMMFNPNSVYAACRANDAGTKVIYTDHVGNDVTCWPIDWTINKKATAAMLRKRLKVPDNG